MRTLPSHLEGRWIEGAGAGQELVNPSTEEPIARVSTDGLDFGRALAFARGDDALRHLAQRVQRAARRTHQAREIEAAARLRQLRLALGAQRAVAAAQLQVEPVHFQTSPAAQPLELSPMAPLVIAIPVDAVYVVLLSGYTETLKLDGKLREKLLAEFGKITQVYGFDDAKKKYYLEDLRQVIKQDSFYSFCGELFTN